MALSKPARIAGDRAGGWTTSFKSACAAGLLSATAAAVLAPATWSPAAAQADPPAALPQGTSFNIPAQPLSSAISAFIKASGWQVGYSSSIAKGVMSSPVSGTMPPAQALKALLAGTDISVSMTGASTATLSAGGGAGEGATVDGAIALDTIDVSGAGGSAAGDVPYQTPGSVNYISSEQIARFPGKTAGDIFKGTPGVISGMNRNGAAVDVNIRGLQGMGRVGVTIDGSQQSTSTYRGYNGVDNRNYVDPDLISGVTITKGPDGGAVGAIGGTVAVETLKVDDILKPGDAYGVRIKGELSDNSITPVIGSTGPRNDDEDGLFGAKSGSIALASKGENIDVVAAYARRKSGNYFAGTQGPLTSTDVNGAQEPLSAFKYGSEVFNTSEDVTSYLLKGAMRLAEDQKLQLGYMRYENTFGEVTPTIVVSTNNSPRQVPLSGITIDQLTANYAWKPVDNDLIDLKANAWMSNTDEDSVYSVYIYSDYRYTQTKSYGLNVSNTSRFDLASLPVALSYGGKATLEDASQRQRLEERTSIINPPEAAARSERCSSTERWSRSSGLRSTQGSTTWRIAPTTAEGPTTTLTTVADTRRTWTTRGRGGARAPGSR